MKIAKAEIAATPASNPSSPSMKFIALVSTTVSSTVSTMPCVWSRMTRLPPVGPSSGSHSTCHWTPNSTSTPAARICPASLAIASRSNLSSSTPTRQISPPAASTPTISDDETNAAPRAGSCSAISTAPAKPAYTATPPIRGIGSECTSRSRIGVTAPIRTAISRTTPVSRKVTTTAVPNTSAYSRAGIAKSATRPG